MAKRQHACIVQSIELACAAMELVLEDIKCIGVKGVRGMWKVKKDDVDDIGDEIFVRINPINSSLVRLVCWDTEFAPKPLPHNFSITFCWLCTTHCAQECSAA